VDYVNKMVELVSLFVTVFNTHMCSKKLTQRQKFKKTTLDRRTKRCTEKKYNCLRQRASRTFVCNVKFLS